MQRYTHLGFLGVQQLISLYIWWQACSWACRVDMDIHRTLEMLGPGAQWVWCFSEISSHASSLVTHAWKGWHNLEIPGAFRRKLLVYNPNSNYSNIYWSYICITYIYYLYIIYIDQIFTWPCALFPRASTKWVSQKVIGILHRAFPKYFMSV